MSEFALLPLTQVEGYIRLTAPVDNVVEEECEEKQHEMMEDEECITLKVNLNGSPIQPKLCAEVNSIPQFRQISRRSGSTQLSVQWEDLPAIMRTAFEHRLVRGKNSGYLNVSKQPGSGTGYQVQYFINSQRRHIRLGTVSDEKVGALMVSAASMDDTLRQASLICRDWLVKMMNNENFCQDWLVRHNLLHC